MVAHTTPTSKPEHAIHPRRWAEGRVAANPHWTDRLYSLQVEAPIKPFEAGQFGLLGLAIGSMAPAWPLGSAGGGKRHRRNTMDAIRSVVPDIDALREAAAVFSLNRALSQYPAVWQAPATAS